MKPKVRMRDQAFILPVTNYNMFSTNNDYFEIMAQSDLFRYAVIPGLEGAHGEPICSVSEVKQVCDKNCHIVFF